MQKNFSLSQNMQMPRKRVVTDTNLSTNFDEKIEKLSKSYEIHKIKQIKNFIIKNTDLIHYLNTITPIINNHFPNHKKCITFCEDLEFEKLDEITIYINSFESEFEKDWKTLDKLEMELCCLDGFSTKLKGLVSVDLWL